MNQIHLMHIPKTTNDAAHLHHEQLRSEVYNSGEVADAQKEVDPSPVLT
jgi:hypothetical protein